MIKRVEQPFFYTPHQLHSGLFLHKLAYPNSPPQTSQISPSSHLHIIDQSSSILFNHQPSYSQSHPHNQAQTHTQPKQFQSTVPISQPTPFRRRPLFLPREGNIRFIERYFEEEKSSESGAANTSKSGLVIGYINSKNKQLEKEAIKAYIRGHRSRLESALSELPKNDPIDYQLRLKKVLQDLTQIECFMEPLESVSIIHDMALAKQIREFYHEVHHKKIAIANKLDSGGEEQKRRAIEMAVEIDVKRRGGIVPSLKEIERAKKRLAVLKGKLSTRDYEESMKLLQ